MSAENPLSSLGTAVRGFILTTGYQGWRQLEVVIRDPHNPAVTFTAQVFCECHAQAPLATPVGREEFSPEMIGILRHLAELDEGLGAKSDGLAAVIEALTGADRRALWDSKGRPGDLEELRRRGLVAHARGRGYFLTEAGERVAERFV